MGATEESLGPYPVIVEMPVQWGALDAFGHVNNTVYFRYFEDARIAYFERVGVVESMESQGVGPILASTQCKFRYPLTYPDTIRAGARVTKLGSDRFLMEYLVVSETHQIVAAQGEGVIVSFDYKANQKIAVPEAWRESIFALEEEVETWHR